MWGCGGDSAVQSHSMGGVRGRAEGHTHTHTHRNTHRNVHANVASAGTYWGYGFVAYGMAIFQSPRNILRGRNF